MPVARQAISLTAVDWGGRPSQGKAIVKASIRHYKMK